MRINRKVALLALLVTAAGAVAVAPADAALGAVVPVSLGTVFGLDGAVVIDQSEDGRVIGQSSNHGIIWANGRIFDLGANALPVGVNDRGLVVGHRIDSVGQTAYQWDADGRASELLPGMAVDHHTIVEAVNNNGDAVVVTVLRSDGTVKVGLLHAGTIAEFRAPAGFSEIQAVALNERGQAAATVTDGSRTLPARCDVTSCVVLPVPDGTMATTVEAINESGQIAGTVNVGGESAAVRWTGDHATVLATLGGPSSRVADNRRAINDRGDVVGTAKTAAGATSPVIWRDGGQPLAIAASGRANAVNSAGEVVGSTTINGSPRGYLWRGGSLTELGPVLFMTNSTAVTINDAGQIVGNSSIAPFPPPNLYSHTEPTRWLRV